MKREKVSQSGGGFRNLFITFIQKTFTDFFPPTKIVTWDNSTDSTDIAKKWTGLLQQTIKWYMVVGKLIIIPALGH